MAKQSLLSGLRTIIGGSSSDLSPNELASRRSAAEAELQAAEREYRKAALGAENGVAGAIAAKTEAAGAVRLAQERVRDVLAAQVEAEATRRERDRADRVAGIATKLSDAERQLAQRVKDAEEFAKAIATAAKHLEAILAHSTAAANAAPGLLPEGAMIEPSKIMRAVADEVSRVAGVKYGWALGGKFVRSRVFDPARLVPLADTLRGANAFAIQKARRDHD